jgi:dienelactone hydrolase
MTRRFAVASMIAVAVALLPGIAAADGYGRVTFPSHSADGAELTGFLLRPARNQTAPAIVALHGCGGLFDKDGRMSARHGDWAQRFAAAGYVVLLPDSFGSRGLGSLCNTRERGVVPRDRGGDASAAADWLARQAFVDPERIALVGWSNGGSSVLWAVGGAHKPTQHEWRVAIAFYPGCRTPSISREWVPRFKPYVLIGSADDWTSPEPCRQLAERNAVLLIEYPGAVHAFDTPGLARRTRSGVAYSARGDGNVEIGTDPKARSAAIKEVMTILDRAFR